MSQTTLSCGFQVRAFHQCNKENNCGYWSGSHLTLRQAQTQLASRARASRAAAIFTASPYKSLPPAPHFHSGASRALHHLRKDTTKVKPPPGLKRTKPTGHVPEALVAHTPQHRLSKARANGAAAPAGEQCTTQKLSQIAGAGPARAWQRAYPVQLAAHAHYSYPFQAL